MEHLGTVDRGRAEIDRGLCSDLRRRGVAMLLVKFACRASGFRAQSNTKRRAAEAGRRMGIFGR